MSNKKPKNSQNSTSRSIPSEEKQALDSTPDTTDAAAAKGAETDFKSTVGGSEDTAAAAPPRSPTPTSASQTEAHQSTDAGAAQVNRSQTNESQVEGSQAKRSQANSAQTESQQPASARSGAALLYLIMLLIVIAAAIASWWLWQQLQTANNRLDQFAAQSEQQQQLSQSSQQRLSQSLSKNSNDLASARRKLGEFNDEMQQTQQQLDRLQAKVQRISGRNRTEWLLAEAEYLLRLAAERLRLYPNKEVIVTLLTSADERLRSIGDASLLEVRQTIAADLAKVRAVEVPSSAERVLELAALRPLIKDLPIFTPQLQPEPLEVEFPEQGDWQSRLSTGFKQFVNDAVRIRNKNEIKPVLTTDERATLVQNLMLTLQMAELAALQQQPALYREKLQQTIDWLEQYFLLDNQQGEYLLHQLGALLDKPLVADFPERLQSPERLAKFTQRRLQQWLQDVQADQPGEQAVEQATERNQQQAQEQRPEQVGDKR